MIALPFTHHFGNLGAIEPIVNLGRNLLRLSELASHANGLVKGLRMNAQNAALVAGIWKHSAVSMGTKSEIRGVGTHGHT